MPNRLPPSVMLSRRRVLASSAAAFGAALGAPRLGDVWAAPSAAGTKPTHHKPTAKRVIFLFMAGAPSQLDMFDYKPQLARFDGTLPPKELLEGYRAAFINPKSALLGPQIGRASCRERV